MKTLNRIYFFMLTSLFVVAVFLCLPSLFSNQAFAMEGENDIFNQIVSPGVFHTCVVTEAQKVMCTGYNAHGQLGDGTRVQNKSIAVEVKDISNVISVSSNYLHNCALLNTGKVKCWGYGAYGQLGDGNRANYQLTPVEVNDLDEVKQIQVGYVHSCALLKSGKVKCWGYGAYGQLGDGNRTNYQLTPVEVSGINNAKQISVGDYHTCALLEDGKVKCWGFGYYGQLGNGTNTRYQATPLEVTNLSDVKKIALGSYHTCVVSNSGNVKCWGYGASGQMGNGTQTNINLLPVDVKDISNANDVSAKKNNTCVNTDDGKVKCWGNNSYGQIGNNTRASYVLTSVEAQVSDSVAIAVGGYHACSMQKSGKVLCWGYGLYGQVGQGSTATYQLAPVEMKNIFYTENYLKKYSEAKENVLVEEKEVDQFDEIFSPEKEVDQFNKVISPGRNHTCFVTAMGKVMCTGYGYYGQLGDGARSQQLAPVEVKDINNAVSVVSDYFHSCALLDTGKIMCWGYGGFGQLGDGNRTPYQTTPIEVKDITNAKQVAAGYNNTCALLDDGKVMCWGSGGLGQIGNKTTVPYQTLPTLVSGIDNATQIVLGDYHACALLTDNTVKCWGQGDSGQLGNGNLEKIQSTPSLVSGIASAKQIALGSNHTCALLQDSTVKCWGQGTLGQIGDNTLTQINSIPQFVKDLSNVNFISAKFNNTCAQTIDGKAYCWGDNSMGQVGNGLRSANVPAPAEVKIANSMMIETGGNHACSVQKTGKVMCWGNGSNGQFGQGVNVGYQYAPLEMNNISFTENFLKKYSVPEDFTKKEITETVEQKAETISKEPTPVVHEFIAQNMLHTCIIQDGGKVKCAGTNNYNLLANGASSKSQPLMAEVNNISNAISITAGYSHTCVLLDTGKIKCWGQNQFGQLGGAGTTQNINIVIDVPGIDNAIAVEAGYNHTCAILSTGKAKCWGSGSYGQLGFGKAYSQPNPTEVPSLSEVKGLACGGSYTYFLLNNGSVMTSNGKYLQEISYVSGAKAIFSGDGHICAVMDKGKVICWGGNTYGQLGNMTTSQPTSIQTISGLGGVQSMALGNGHTCALLATGKVACWGSNSYGQIGDGTSGNSQLTPTVVSNINKAIAVSAGGHSTCALLETGKAMCWGNNQVGQLGSGSMIEKQTSPVEIKNVDFSKFIEQIKTETTEINSASIVAKKTFIYTFAEESLTKILSKVFAIRQTHSCSIQVGGKVMCLGQGSAGQLGNNITVATQPTLVEVADITNATQVVNGYDYSCALLATGEVMCWGKDNYGQTGLGAYTYPGMRLKPIMVADVSNATEVVAGYAHTCALLENGKVMCWGYGVLGQIGNNSLANAYRAQEVKDIQDAIDIDAGAYHTCAILKTGKVMCWGQGNSAQNGNYELRNQIVPGEVKMVSDAKQVYCGDQHTCILNASNDVICLGHNGSGEIGNKTTVSPQIVPSKIDDLGDVKSLALGSYYSCALLKTGEVACWGRGSVGQLGNGKNSAKELDPVLVYNINNAIAIYAGGDSACALLETGKLSCWGSNNYSQLGNGQKTNQLIPTEYKDLDFKTVIDEAKIIAKNAVDSNQENEEDLEALVKRDDIGEKIYDNFSNKDLSTWQMNGDLIKEIIYDEDRQSRVFQLRSAGRVELKINESENKIIAWDQDLSGDDYRIFWLVSTMNNEIDGVAYVNGYDACKKIDKMVYCGLGDMTTGWATVVRDIQKDIQSVAPGVEIKSINKFYALNALGQLDNIRSFAVEPNALELETEADTNISKEEKWTVYEDAEDGAKDGWSYYANNYYDPVSKNHYIYGSGYYGPSSFVINNYKDFKVSWDIRAGRNAATWNIETPKEVGISQIIYNYSANDNCYRQNATIICNVGKAASNQWQTFVRDLRADLKSVLPTAEIIKISSVSISDSNIDNIKLAKSSGQTTAVRSGKISIYEDAEDGNTDGWFKNTSFWMDNVYDDDRASRVMALNSKTPGFYLINYNTVIQPGQFVASWDQKTVGDYRVIFYLTLENNATFSLEYNSADKACFYNRGKVVYCGLGSGTRDKWVNISRDLQKDLLAISPNLKIKNINHITFGINKGSKIDNLRLAENIPITQKFVNNYSNAKNLDFGKINSYSFNRWMNEQYKFTVADRAQLMMNLGYNNTVNRTLSMLVYDSEGNTVANLSATSNISKISGQLSKTVNLDKPGTYYVVVSGYSEFMWQLNLIPTDLESLASKEIVLADAGENEIGDSPDKAVKLLGEAISESARLKVNNLGIGLKKAKDGIGMDIADVIELSFAKPGLISIYSSSKNISGKLENVNGERVLNLNACDPTIKNACERAKGMIKTNEKYYLTIEPIKVNNRIVASYDYDLNFDIIQLENSAVFDPNAYYYGADDHGNSIYNATKIEINRGISGRIERLNDVDVFKISIPERGYLRLSEYQLPHWLPNYRKREGADILISAAKSIYLFNKYSNAYNWNSMSVGSGSLLLEPGDYYISVSSSNSRYYPQGTYTLLPVFIPENLPVKEYDFTGEKNPTASLMMPAHVKIKNPVIYSGNVYAPQLVQNFSLNRGGDALLLVNTSITYCNYYRDNGGGNYAPQYRCYLPVADKLPYVGRTLASNSGYSGGGYLNYDLIYIPYCLSKEGNSHAGITCAKELEMSTSTSGYKFKGEIGSISINNIPTYYSFELPAKESVRIESDLWNTDTIGYLFDSEGKLLAHDRDSGKGGHFKIVETLEAGKYYIKVEGQSSGIGVVGGDYRLDIYVSDKYEDPSWKKDYDSNDDYGNSCTKAESVRIGQTITGKIERYGDVDVFAVSTPIENNKKVPGTLQVYIEGLANPQLEIKDAYCTKQLAGGASPSDLIRADKGLQVKSDQPEMQYYIIVSNQDSRAGAYQLHVNFYNKSEEDNIGDDHGDDCVQAKEVKPTSDTAGKIGNMKDIDVFNINMGENVGKKGKLYVYATGMKNVDLRAKKQGCQEVPKGLKIGTDLTTKEGGMVFEVDSFDHNYYIEVREKTGGQGSYVLHAELELIKAEEPVSAVDEAGDSCAKAKVIEVGSVFNGQINFENDVDVFKFKLPDGPGMLKLYTEEMPGAYGELQKTDTGTLLIKKDRFDISENQGLRYRYSAKKFDELCLLVKKNDSKTGKYKLHIDFEANPKLLIAKQGQTKSELVEDLLHLEYNDGRTYMVEPKLKIEKKDGKYIFSWEPVTKDQIKEAKDYNKNLLAMADFKVAANFDGAVVGGNADVQLKCKDSVLYKGSASVFEIASDSQALVDCLKVTMEAIDNGEAVALDEFEAPVEAVASKTKCTEFSDINKEEWYCKAINFGLKEGWLDGAKDAFRPTDSIDRAEFSKLLSIAMKYDVPESVSSNPFTDVDKSIWYAKYISVLKDEKIIEGYENGTIFRPNNPITTPEALKMILTALGFKNDKDDACFSGFVGIGYQNEWYANYLGAALKNEIVQSDTFSPDTALSRSRMVYIMFKAFSNENIKNDLRSGKCYEDMARKKFKEDDDIIKTDKDFQKAMDSFGNYLVETTSEQHYWGECDVWTKDYEKKFYIPNNCEFFCDDGVPTLGYVSIYNPKIGETFIFKKGDNSILDKYVQENGGSPCGDKIGLPIGDNLIDDDVSEDIIMFENGAYVQATIGNIFGIQFPSTSVSDLNNLSWSSALNKGSFFSYSDFEWKAPPSMDGLYGDILSRKINIIRVIGKMTSDTNKSSIYSKVVNVETHKKKGLICAAFLLKNGLYSTMCSVEGSDVKGNKREYVFDINESNDYLKNLYIENGYASEIANDKMFSVDDVSVDKTSKEDISGIELIDLYFCDSKWNNVSTIEDKMYSLACYSESMFRMEEAKRVINAQKNESDWDEVIKGAEFGAAGLSIGVFIKNSWTAARHIDQVMDSLKFAKIFQIIKSNPWTFAIETSLEIPVHYYLEYRQCKDFPSNVCENYTGLADTSFRPEFVEKQFLNNVINPYLSFSDRIITTGLSLSPDMLEISSFLKVAGKYKTAIYSIENIQDLTREGINNAVKLDTTSVKVKTINDSVNKAVAETIVESGQSIESIRKGVNKGFNSALSGESILLPLPDDPNDIIEFFEFYNGLSQEQRKLLIKGFRQGDGLDDVIATFKAGINTKAADSVVSLVNEINSVNIQIIVRRYFEDTSFSEFWKRVGHGGENEIAYFKKISKAANDALDYNDNISSFSEAFKETKKVVEQMNQLHIDGKLPEKFKYIFGDIEAVRVDDVADFIKNHTSRINWKSSTDDQIKEAMNSLIGKKEAVKNKLQSIFPDVDAKKIDVGVKTWISAKNKINEEGISLAELSDVFRGTVEVNDIDDLADKIKVFEEMAASKNIKIIEFKNKIRKSLGNDAGVEAISYKIEIEGEIFELQFKTSQDKMLGEIQHETIPTKFAERFPDYVDANGKPTSKGEEIIEEAGKMYYMGKLMEWDKVLSKYIN